MAHLARRRAGSRHPGHGSGRRRHLSPAVRRRTGRNCQARLITVIPGSALEGEPITIDLAEQVGALAGRVQRRTSRTSSIRPPDVFSTGTSGGPPRWYGGSVTDPGLLELATRIELALAAAARLAGGGQHADVTLTNVLAEGGQVTGLDRLRRHAPHRRRLRPRRHPDLGPPQHRRRATGRRLESRRRRAPRLSAAPDAERGRGRGARRTRPRPTGPDRDDLRHPRPAAHRQPGLHHPRTTGRTSGCSTRSAPLVRPSWPSRFHRSAGTCDEPGSRPPTAARGRDGRSLSPLFYRQPLDIVRGEGPWLIRAGRPPLPRCLQQRCRRRSRPSGRHPGRQPTARHA